MAPLIDMVFIMLIFFIVTTSFVKEAGVEVHRPDSRQARAIEERFLPVAITKSGSVYLGRRIVRPDAVEAVARALEEAGLSRIVIQADREVPTGLLLQVLDTCRAAGAQRVDVAAREP